MAVTADTVATPFAAAKPWERVTSRDIDSPAAQGAERMTSRGIPPFMHGLRPEPRGVLPGYDSGVMSLLIIVFLFLSVNFRSFGSFLHTYTPYLWKERRRDSFYDTHTLSETRVLLSLLMLATVSEGVIAFSLINYHGGIPAGTTFISMSAVIGIAVAYYIAQVAAYNYVGYLFFDPDRTRQWLKGFNASQSLLGIALAIPALIVLFNPGSAPLLAIISILLYLTARVIFIIKGIRLFYDKIGSLIYLILYLCTLEFIPLFLVYRYIWK